MRTTVSPLRRHLANSFGVAGYGFAVLVWLWLAAICLPPLLKSDALHWTLPQTTGTRPSAPVPDLSLPPAWMLVLGAFVTIVMIAITLYILIKVPVQAVKSTSSVAHHTAERLIPVVVHHKKVSQKRARLIGARLLFYLKLALACLPILLSPLILLVPQAELPFDLIILVAASLSLLAVLSFALQSGISRWLRVPVDRLL